MLTWNGRISVSSSSKNRGISVSSSSKNGGISVSLFLVSVLSSLSFL